MTGVVFVKDAGSWKCLNFNGQHVWTKDAGTWKDPTSLYVKHSASWKKVYPSLTETWTTAGYGDTIDIGNDGVTPTINVAATPLSNATTGGIIQWRAGADIGEILYVRDFDWAPSTTAGFAYGAISRLEITFQAKCSTGSHSIEVGPLIGDRVHTGALTTSYVLYTMDYTIADWGLSNNEANEIHTNPNGNANIYFQPDQGVSGFVSIKEIKARIKYYSN